MLHDQLCMIRWGYIFESSRFGCASRGNIRFPHVSVDDIIFAGFTRGPVSNAANLTSLVALV